MKQQLIQTKRSEEIVVDMIPLPFDKVICRTKNILKRIVETNKSPYGMRYDDNGNLISGFGMNYSYNGFNWLVNVSNGGILVAEYWYDDSGVRVKSVVYSGGENETTYYFDNFVQIVNSSGVYNETYYYYYDRLVGVKDSSGDVLFYHPDHLGSSTLVTDINGAVVEEMEYEPFGSPVESSDERYTYTGQEQDVESGLMYYGARYYDPDLAKFVQTDPVIGDIYNPQDLNKYAYVRNNPFKYVDPDGEFLCGGLCIIGGVAITSALIGGGITYYNTGDLSKAVTAGVISGAAGGLSAGLVVAASTTAVAYGSGVLYTGLSTGSLATTSLGLLGIGGLESIAEQTLVGGKSFNEVSWIDVGVSSLVNVGGAVIPSGRKAGQFFPYKSTIAMAKEVGKQVSISTGLSVAEEIINSGTSNLKDIGKMTGNVGSSLSKVSKNIGSGITKTVKTGARAVKKGAKKLYKKAKFW